MSETTTEARPLDLRLQSVAGMISMGEKIAWGADTSLMNEAVEALRARDARIRELEEALREAAGRLRRAIAHAGTDAEYADAAVAKYRALLPQEPSQ